MTLRWTFPDPREAAARASVDAAIDAWWQALAGIRGRLAPQLDQSFDLMAFVAQHLQCIHPDLRWELRPGVTARWCFVVTAEEDRHLEPLVARVVSRAPAQLGFEVAPERTRESLPMALATVKGRFGVDAADWTVEFGPPQHGFVNVCWRGAPEPEPAVWLMKCLVGERAVMDWVGPVEVGRPSLRAKLFRGSRIGPAEFATAFEAQQRLLLEERPSRPLQRRDTDSSWSVVSLKRDGPPEGRLGDVVSAATNDVAFLELLLSGAPFSPRRLSRFGESFAYVQLPVPPEEGLRLRTTLEDALDQALAPNDLGRCITSATGTRNTYVVLVLRDLREGVDRARQVLETAGVPRGTCLRFPEDSLSAEWVGVFPDTPPPSD
jgi:hypothetical protein